MLLDANIELHRAPTALYVVSKQLHYVLRVWANRGSSLARKRSSFAERARTLVHLGRIGSISTLSRKQLGFPFDSVMPYSLEELGRPIFLISTMAMHTQNLKADRTVTESELAQTRKLYLERYANSKYWVDYEDFSFYRMEVVDVYYVGGFGVMGWVAASEYSAAQPASLADAMAGIIEHMNADHRIPSSCLRRSLPASRPRRRR
jgi:putative heme iron utilization protein